MQVAVCLLPERELAAELVVFAQSHATWLGAGVPSLATNRPRLLLCSGEVDEWAVTPELLEEMAPPQPLAARFGALSLVSGTIFGPLVSMGGADSRALVSLQARITVRLGLQLPDSWIPGIELGKTTEERLRPTVKAGWATTMEGRAVALNRLGFLRLDADGRAHATIASHALG
ncbi:MAG: hypothetical protein ACRDAX_09565 [Propionibacteriaceae bacterium]